MEKQMWKEGKKGRKKLSALSRSQPILFLDRYIAVLAKQCGDDDGGGVSKMIPRPGTTTYTERRK